MNEFTKEELKFINNHVHFSIHYNGLEYNEFVANILIKIQSMIDSYCEHEDLKDVGKEYKVCRTCGEELTGEYITKLQNDDALGATNE